MNALVHIVMLVAVVMHGLQWQPPLGELVLGYLVSVVLWELGRAFFSWLLGPVTVGSVSVTKR